MRLRTYGIWIIVVAILCLPGLALAEPGLWTGQIEISKVNEVGFGVTDTETTQEVTNPFDMRILLHEDAAGKVQLLSHVTLMQESYEENGEEMVRRVLLTDDSQLYKFEGVSRRDGEMVGIRLGSLFFDWDEGGMSASGTVQAGKTLEVSLTLSADHPHNPFRHLYHPDHRSGRDINRAITLTFASPLSDAPNARTAELSGKYEETITGIHNTPIRLEGSFQIERVSTIAVLNEAQ
ncbi:MAG: hypothetical protein B6245_05125 [Desulfobacteraceae bacterium 4572_88]|nr:MAG: hypothetical protein B6245_05125 [Desulfobacteraceae bacterium 4572_88]RLC19841.1 MAG: hypothetical protein DRI57_06165 [Deltaproteobacteria bacterium]